MPRIPQDEQAYLLRRSEDHRVLAGQAATPEIGAIHERFVELYARSAAALLVEDD